MIEKLNLHYSFTNPASIHDEEALTALELAGRQGAKINEIVADQNNLREETENHLEKQDGYNEETRTEILPDEVRKEVARRIQSGEFDYEINQYIGNLEARVDNLVSSVPEGGTTADAELIDIRTGSTGAVFNNAGEAVRNLDVMQSIDYALGIDGRYVSAGGAVEFNDAFAISEPISVIPGEILHLDVVVANEYLSHIVFSPTDSVTQYSEKFTTDKEEELVITVPAGMHYAYITWQKEFEKPRLWVEKNNACNALKDWCNSPARNLAGEIIPLEYDNTDRFSGGRWLNDPTLNFAVSQPIAVTEGDVYSITSTLANEYVALVVFQTAEEKTPGNVVSYIQDNKCGEHLIVIPSGAKIMYVRNSVDAGNNISGYCEVKRLNLNLYEIVTPLINDIALGVKSDVSISLPDFYNLVEGETFELFFNGVIKANDIDNYNIRTWCSVGNAYKRKFVFTPTNAHIGEHALNIQLTDNVGNIITSASTTLKVNAKAATASAHSVLCVGDSLTASGEWVNEVKSLLHNNGLTGVNFIGRKGDNAKYEATGGWSINYYIGTDPDKNPFYNTSTGKIDIKNYVNTYGGTLDTVIILLGWNSTFSNESTYKANMKTFIDAVRSDFPSARILLYGIQIPSIDGFGESYGCAWNFREKVEFVFNLNKWLANIASEYTGVRFVNVAGQFDTLYGMPHEERPVNKRCTETETVGTNGVHPNYSGYMQIADIGYRELNAIMGG